MGCYRPMMGLLEDTECGTRHYKITTMNDEIYSSLSPSGAAIQIPCGKCLGCRLDNSKMWSDRILMESKMYEFNYFLTLTYNDEYAPSCILEDDAGSMINIQTLALKDWQDFMKRLRKHFADYCKKEGLNYDDYKVRYFACGEYGDSTSRPHMHAILFNLRLNDVIEKKGVPPNKFGDKILESETINRLWPYGFAELGTVTPRSAGYVSRYVLKKAFSETRAHQSEDREKEFVVMSRKPGIGKAYYETHPNMFLTGSFCLATEEGSVKIKMPRYFKQFADTDDLRTNRKIAGNITRLAKNQQTDLDYISRLTSEEEIKKQKMNIFKRTEI